MSSNPPQLFDHDTWADATGFHGRYKTELPPGAIAYGCRQTVSAPTARELVHEAVRNRLAVWIWDSRRRVLAATGDWRELQDSR